MNHTQSNPCIKLNLNCHLFQVTLKACNNPSVHTRLTMLFSVEPAEQVVAGLLQQDIIVSFICAVWIIVATKIAQPVH